MRSTFLLAVVLVLNIGGGGPPSATQEVPPPNLQGFPTAPAPNELATVTLPDTASAVTALFERLPAEVAGHTRSPQLDRISPERAVVGYGVDRRIPGVRAYVLWLQAIDLSRGDFFPRNWTGGHVVAYMARLRKEPMEAGRDGNLFWMREEAFVEAAGSAERFPVYGTLLGIVDSPWMFSIHADARDNRDALLAAFVTAAKSSPR
jgi:hypothetical protein